MSRLIIPFVLSAFLLAGCADAKIDAKAEIQTQVDLFLKAHLESLIKAQIDTKVQGVGVDIKNKLAEDIKSELQTEIQSMFAANTQNVGMFSGGAIYVVIVVIAFFIFLFGTIVWLVKSLMNWKKVWHLLSSSIEANSTDKDHAELVKKIKSQFSSTLEVTGLKQLVDQNLEKRGLRRSL